MARYRTPATEVLVHVIEGATGRPLTADADILMGDTREAAKDLAGK